MKVEQLKRIFNLDELLELRHQAHSLGMASHHLINTNFSGIYASVFRGQGLNFEEVREYVAGDDIRNMDWKVTARTGKPHLKIFREERERHVLLCVDQGSHMHFATRGTLKSIQAAKAAALLGWAALNQHDCVGGVIFTKKAEYFRPRSDHRSLWRLLKYMSEEHQYGRSSTQPLINVLKNLHQGINSGSVIFIFSDFNRELNDLKQELIKIRQKHTVILCALDDPADYQLPQMGQQLFHDAQQQVISVDTNDEAGQKAYFQQWETRREQLKLLCIKLNMGFIAINTDDEIHQALSSGLHQCQHIG